jgi:hypothetical protein
MNSPFQFGKLAENKTFVNRAKERATLKNNLLSGINTSSFPPSENVQNRVSPSIGCAELRFAPIPRRGTTSMSGVFLLTLFPYGERGRIIRFFY